MSEGKSLHVSIQLTSENKYASYQVTDGFIYFHAVGNNVLINVFLFILFAL